MGVWDFDAWPHAELTKSPFWEEVPSKSTPLFGVV